MKHYGYGFVFIYNPLQKAYYIDEGCNLIDSDINKNTKKTYWVFKFDDVQETFKKWCDRNK
jgi:hypothetical protein